MNLQAPRLPLSRGAGPNGLRGDPAAAGQRLTERLSQIRNDLSVSAAPSHLPGKGRLEVAPPKGFPYEGKLSAVRLTDEVGRAA